MPVGNVIQPFKVINLLQYLETQKHRGAHISITGAGSSFGVAVTPNPALARNPRWSGQRELSPGRQVGKGMAHATYKPHAGRGRLCLSPGCSLHRLSPGRSLHSCTRA